MIAIINKGPVGKSRDRRKYNVQINNKLITTFQHNRSDGLAKCLELAAQAVRQQENAVLLDIVDKSV